MQLDVDPLKSMVLLELNQAIVVLASVVYGAGVWKLSHLKGLGRGYAFEKVWSNL
jgi:hypothetical protein